MFLSFGSDGVFSSDADLLALEPDLLNDYSPQIFRLIHAAPFEVVSADNQIDFAYAGDILIGGGFVAKLVGSGPHTPGCWLIKSASSGSPGFALLAPLFGQHSVSEAGGPSCHFDMGETGVVDVYTFNAVAISVARDWMAAWGLDQRNQADRDRIVNPEVMRTASAYLTLARIYDGRASALGEVPTSAGVTDVTRGSYRGIAAGYLSKAKAAYRRAVLIIQDDDGVKRERRLADSHLERD